VNGGTRSENINSAMGEDKLSDWLLGIADRRKALFDFPGDAEGDLPFQFDDIIEGIDFKCS
jgi:hypothetical protein